MLRRELGVEVDERMGSYGEFTVRVGETVVLAGGPLGWLGVLPTGEETLAAVRAEMAGK